MGLFSKLFKKENKIEEQEAQAPVVHVPNEDERMNWAIEKAKLTLHYFQESLENPTPEQQYFSVKIQFEENEQVEHIWLGEPSFDNDGNVYGIVGNEPQYITTIESGSKVGMPINQISDWMIIENDRLIGGYTIRAIRDGMQGEELQAFDESVGMLIDEGRDYIKPNFETPESAIVALEEAYNNEDLEQAIQCKDFYKEAELMLSTMGKLGSDEGIVEKTAEVLRLSFIKSMQDNGFPKFNNVSQAFIAREIIDENHMIISEVCAFEDGKKTLDKLRVCRNDDGWKVIGPVD